jgi:ABC-type Fe3+ transport system permease subunit
LRLLGPQPATRIRHITTGILAAGLGSAALIFLFARSQTDNALGYDPMDTKRYLRDLELFGGKGNVLATEFSLWWQGLWHGRNLAFTVAFLTVLLALAFWFIATRRARELDPLEEASGPADS